ncbi:DUF1653 domain-containing protein [Pseudomonadota bacterium AL_CKDN230030165-1A_HGKHYDSX7]
MNDSLDTFRPGVYRYYKGQQYLALGLARADETDETVVVYVRLYPRDGMPMNTRLLRIWNETVETEAGIVPRFAYVGPQSPA